jgi:hypothetical protein
MEKRLRASTVLRERVMNSNSSNTERLKPTSYLALAVTGRALLCVVLKDGSELHECFLKAFSHDDLLLETEDGEVMVNRAEVRLIRGETREHYKHARESGRK